MAAYFISKHETNGRGSASIVMEMTPEDNSER